MRRTLTVPLWAVLAAALLSLGFAATQTRTPSTATPAELVATYDKLADGILAVKHTEEKLVRSILATTYAHAQSALQRALRSLQAGEAGEARSAVEELAAHVAQLGTEGDNAVAGVRKRLLEGGHHHNAEGEKQGIYDEGVRGRHPRRQEGLP